MRVKLIAIGICLVILTTLGVVAATSRAATPAPVLKPAASYAPPAITVLQPEPSRTPVKPGVADRTVLAAMPAGIGLTSIPQTVTRPVRTNAWWSSGAMDAWPAPLFPLPFKAQFSTNGLVLTVPGRRVQDKAVLATDGDPLRIFTASPATGAAAIIAGDWDVTFRLRDTASTQFDATLIQGSPFIFIRPTGSTISIALPAGATASPVDCRNDCGSAMLVTGANTRYLLVSTIRSAFTARGGVIDVRFQKGSALLTVAAVAPGSDPLEYLATAVRPYTRTQAAFAVTATDVFTTFRYPVTTLIGVLPHHIASLAYNAPDNGPKPFIEGNPSKIIGEFETVRGPLRLYKAKGFRTMLPRPAILPSLPPVPAATADQSIHQTMRMEIEQNLPPAGDVYSIVKLLNRTAQLAELAETLGEKELKSLALAQIRLSLQQSCSNMPGAPLSFAYDANAGGIVTFPVAFGSEHYNDHHFHYGYLLHAAAVVARMDPSFLSQYGDCFRLLARDIASSNPKDPSFPYLRYFDPYSGHSWANGVTTFGDGTNQESVSEAMYAWHALALFGHTAQNVNMENLGLWLYAQESQAARVYWFNADPAAGTIPAGFPYPMLSILWSGKADYATFFDGSDAAIRGIQFFPISSALLPILSEDITSRIITPAARAAQNTIWKSSLTLAEAVYHQGTTIAADAPIDPGLSRSYVNYWQKALPALGLPAGPTGKCLGYTFQKGNKLMVAVYRFAQDPETCAFKVKLKAVNLVKLGFGWTVRELGL